MVTGVKWDMPMEQHLLNQARIENISVDDIRNLTQNVYNQMDALSKVPDKIYVRIDLGVLDASEMPYHNYPTENGPTSHEWAAMFTEIFSKYPKVAAIGFASIPTRDPENIGLNAVNRMTMGAVEGIMISEGKI